MKVLLLALSGAVAYAQLEASDITQDCYEDEFLADGLTTGQNIEMDYEASQIHIVDGVTNLGLTYLVPARYAKKHGRDDTFAITFHRTNSFIDNNDGTAQDGSTYADIDMRIGAEDGKIDAGCFSNHHANYTYCDVSDPARMTEMNELWANEVTAENACMVAYTANMPWESVTQGADGWFSQVSDQVNGNWLEIFLMATVETWTHFTEGASTNFVGYMTGTEEWLGGDSADTENRKGGYGGDGGWRGWPENPDSGNFGDMVFDDERYTLYQIPFILRFPRTVLVETSFRVAQKITVLSGLIAQDIIQVNLNPEDDDVFAYLEATLKTQVQYPYGIVAPLQTGANNPMTIWIGNEADRLASADPGTHAAEATFIDWEHPSACQGQPDFHDKGHCEQSFKFRLKPNNAVSPCSVAGEYFFEMWATCMANPNADDMPLDNTDTPYDYDKNSLTGPATKACAIDDVATSTDLEDRRSSNAYFSQTVTLSHQGFCPELMDEIRVVGDFVVYKDEGFSAQINNDGSDGEHHNDVYTNDQIFFEASYRTASSKSGEDGSSDFTDTMTTADSNGQYGKDIAPEDGIIDFVRATQIFMEVTLGKNRAGTALVGWNADDWDANFKYPLTEFSDDTQRIPGVDAGLVEDTDFTMTVGSDGDGGSAEYRIVLCSADEIRAAEVETEGDLGDKSDDSFNDCFTGIKTVAAEYLDFTKVLRSLTGSANTIEENEVAFNMRMDERILPVSPSLDESHIKVTLESEIYYRGNRHSTRRLLQAEPAQLPSRKQAHAMTVGYSVFTRRPLETCMVDNSQETGMAKLQFEYSSFESMPSGGDMSSFVSSLSMQLDDYHHVRGAVSVEKVERCAKDCEELYARGPHPSVRRRAEEDGKFLLNVYLKFDSVPSNKAGQIINVFQANVANRRSDMYKKVTLFGDADVTLMQINGCNGDFAGHQAYSQDPRRDGKDLEGMIDLIEDDMSSASRPMAMVALALTFVYLW